jgi:hypothetical protein
MIRMVAVSLTDGAIKKSLFVQVAWFNPAALDEQLNHVRDHHKDRTKDDYIYNIVLDEIGTPYGLHTTNLDIIAPYLPGGNKKTFDNVFVGSSFIRYAGPGSAYAEGMANPDHRWANLQVQESLWRRFAARYPSTPHHYYINHEGVLDFFDIPEVRAGYGAYLLQSVRDGHDLTPNRAFLWSPAIWKTVPLSLVEEDAIGTTFRRIETYAKEYGHYGGVKWLHFQDMLGRGRKGVTKYDVKAWYNALKDVYEWDSFRVNMELFNVSAWRAQRREDWYQSQGIVVGTSFEMRHWYPRHKEL